MHDHHQNYRDVSLIYLLLKALNNILQLIKLLLSGEQLPIDLPSGIAWYISLLAQTILAVQTLLGTFDVGDLLHSFEAHPLLLLVAVAAPIRPKHSRIETGQVGRQQQSSIRGMRRYRRRWKVLRLLLCLGRACHERRREAVAVGVGGIVAGVEEKRYCHGRRGAEAGHAGLRPRLLGCRGDHVARPTEYAQGDRQAGRSDAKGTSGMQHSEQDGHEEGRERGAGRRRGQQGNAIGRVQFCLIRHSAVAVVAIEQREHSQPSRYRIGRKSQSREGYLGPQQIDAGVRPIEDRATTAAAAVGTAQGGNSTGREELGICEVGRLGHARRRYGADRLAKARIPTSRWLTVGNALAVVGRHAQ